jgi:hypothetical protein
MLITCRCTVEGQLFTSVSCHLHTRCYNAHGVLFHFGKSPVMADICLTVEVSSEEGRTNGQFMRSFRQFNISIAWIWQTDLNFYPFVVTAVQELSGCDVSKAIFFRAVSWLFWRLVISHLFSYDRRIISPCLPRVGGVQLCETFPELSGCDCCLLGHLKSKVYGTHIALGQTLNWTNAK